MKNLKHILWIAVGVLLIGSCGGPAGETTSDYDPGLTDSTILLGTWGPLTGPAALWGNTTKGLDAYFKMINDDGGINGRMVEMIVKDDAYDPSRTVPAVREMVQKDEVFAFIGGVGTAPGLAVKEFIKENEIPWLAPFSGSTHWAYPPENNLFSVYPLYFDEAQIQVDYAINELGASKVAIIYQNDDFGKSGLVAAEEALKKHGKEMAASVSVEVTDSDLTSHAARLQESGAEVVLLWVTPRHAAIILGATAVGGFKPQWMASTVLADMVLMHDITKGGWEDAIFAFFGAMPYDSTNTTINKYRDAFGKYYPDARWGSFSYSGFAFGEVIAEGLRLAGEDLSRESLISAMENMQGFKGTGPEISFSEGNRQGLRQVFLVQCKGQTTYEILTDYITSDAAVDDLISKLDAS